MNARSEYAVPALLAHLDGLTPELLATAAAVRLACFDVDGTLTDGRLGFDSAGHEFKTFHVHDGQGLVLLRRAGVEVALITARRSQVVERRAEELGVRAFCGVADKLACVRGLAEELGVGLDAVAFMGDDLPDAPPMRAVSLAVSPANAHPWTAAAAHWRTRANGGAGAARELCDLLLGARGALPDGTGDGRRA
jgi:3-deoxy-D-manno-octulosonate 8-phosphate phosphatase (KDO 8-P phosphatase)